MTTKECQSLRKWASALQAERSSLGDVLAEYADAWERETAQPPATSDMPGRPLETVIRPTVTAPDGDMRHLGHTDAAMRSHGTACYAAGRRQGLEEAKSEVDAFRFHGKAVNMSQREIITDEVAEDIGTAIDALLQTRGKNDSEQS